MHILIHSLYFFPEVGGMENHIFYLAKGLKKAGSQVSLVTTRSNHKFSSFENIEGIQVYRRGFGGKTFIPWIINTFSSIPIFIKLSRRADILHCHDIASAFAGLLAKRIHKKPLVLTIHTSHFLRLSQNPFWKRIFHFFVNEGDRILTPSEEIRRRCLEISPDCSAREIVNRIDTDLFKPTEPILKRNTGEVILLCPRRLYPKNGVEYLIRAMPLIRKEVNAILYITGDGPLRNSLESLSEELEVKPYISFEGTIQNREMPAYYSSSDIVIIPSLLEATSLSALEAMACEIPVAASKVGGLPEIIDEKVGTLFEPRNPEDLSEKVIVLLKRKDRKETGKIARERVVQNWSLKELIQIHLDLYSSLTLHKRYEAV